MLNIDDLVKNKFVLEFSKIYLSGLGKIYEGPGQIYQDSDGNLELKMYTFDEEGYKLFAKGKNIKTGKIIPENRYYKLKAYDFFNTVWISNRINFGYELSADHKSLILRSPVYHLSRKQKTIVKFKNPSLVLRFRKNIRFPHSRFVDNQATAYKNLAPYSSSRLIANFIHNNYEFLFYESENWYYSEIISLKGRISEKLEQYTCEALQFILSSNISWEVLEKFEGKTNKIQIRNLREETFSARIPPPISLNTADNSNIWTLFKKYFEFVYSHGNTNYHPISSKLHKVIQSSKGSIDIQAMSITTLIENILISEFSKYFENDKKKKFENDIINLNIDLTKNSYSDEFVNRIKGFLPRLNNFSPKDILKKLIELKLISKSSVKDWENLRHPVAHGKNIDFDDFQKYLTLCYKCQNLFNILIFLLIDYNGKYCDLTKYGFPIKTFKKSITHIKG